MNPILKGIMCLALVTGLAAADGPKVEREVGSDGVTTITIKGKKPAPTEVRPEVIPIKSQKRKAFKVYELEGGRQQRQETTKIIVVGSPPPIAPSAGYGYGFGYGAPFGNGFGVQPFFGPGNFINNGFPINGNRGFRNGNRNFRNVNRGFRSGNRNFSRRVVNRSLNARGSFRGRGYRCR